ncbi:MAG TPA: CoA transferase [Candidatus Binataceae bacterium]|nr:CoA transferase [Candidatus Binataceae bacterium]
MEKRDFYRDARKDLTGPLHGLRVLEATTSWAGPMCGCVLADLGADVIKVEATEGEVGRRVRPFVTGEGSTVSFLHATVNRNKRSLTLDLRSAEGRKIFLGLAARSDVVVQNFRPGTFDKWGLGYDHCRAVKPDIIYVSISGFGLFGPDHDRPGYDPVAEAASGFMSLNGSADGGPVRCATYLGDDLAGLHGALSALAALRHRDQTGEGQHIDVSLMDSILFQSNGYLTLGAIGFPLQRLGNGSLFSAPVNAFECADGHVFLAVLLEPHWRALAKIIGRLDMIDDPRFATMEARHHSVKETDAAVAAWMKTQPIAEVERSLTAAGVPVAGVRTYAEVARSPHVLEREMLQPVEQEDGKTVPITGPAAKFSRTPTRVRRRAASLGEHTDEILAELGLDSTKRQNLRASKVT